MFFYAMSSSKGPVPGFTCGRLDRLGPWPQHMAQTPSTGCYNLLMTKIFRLGKQPLSMQSRSFHTLYVFCDVHMLTAVKEIFIHYYQTQQEFVDQMFCLEKTKQMNDVSGYLYTFSSSRS